MTPEQLAKSDTESAHQTALFAWAALHVQEYPELKWMHHIPNGGTRGADAKSRAIAGARLKAQGVKVGVPDVFLPVKRGPCSGLYIELKKPSAKPKRNGKGGLSEEQLEFGVFVQEQGYGWAVCYGWEAAASLVVSYMHSG
jgi:hypothetical protein